MTSKSNYKIPATFSSIRLCLCHCASATPQLSATPTSLSAQLTQIQCVCNLCGNVAGLIMLINTNVALATLSLLQQHQLLFAIAVAIAIAIAVHCKKHCILTGLRIWVLPKDTVDTAPFVLWFGCFLWLLRGICHSSGPPAPARARAQAQAQPIVLRVARSGGAVVKRLAGPMAGNHTKLQWLCTRLVGSQLWSTTHLCAAQSGPLMVPGGGGGWRLVRWLVGGLPQRLPVRGNPIIFKALAVCWTKLVSQFGRIQTIKLQTHVIIILILALRIGLPVDVIVDTIHLINHTYIHDVLSPRKSPAHYLMIYGNCRSWPLEASGSESETFLTLPSALSGMGGREHGVTGHGGVACAIAKTHTHNHTCCQHKEEEG